jgi:hypothetical protein
MNGPEVIISSCNSRHKTHMYIYGYVCEVLLNFTYKFWSESTVEDACSL